MGTRELECVRRMMLGLPEVVERVSHRAPCFFIGRSALGRFHDHHGGDDRVSLWVRPPPQLREVLLLASGPNRFFEPPSSASGTFGDWVGVYLDQPSPSADEWSEIAAVVDDAFRFVAPNKLVEKFARRQPS